MTFYELDGTTPMVIPEEKLAQDWPDVLKYIRELRDQVLGLGGDCRLGVPQYCYTHCHSVPYKGS